MGLEEVSVNNSVSVRTLMNARISLIRVWICGSQQTKQFQTNVRSNTEYRKLESQII